jgi:hypothetical protein
MQPKSTKKILLVTKGIRIQEFFWMKKPNVNHGLYRSQILDEEVKIG